VLLRGYHRGAALCNNSFTWIGASALAAWGRTGRFLDANRTRPPLKWPVGPDARDGEQPHGTLVVGNLAREIGVFQKQSSFWFQAATVATRLVGNVHFNGPRAGINFNDGLGGGDEVARNLLANTCRESGDHGPINSWDRVPYITTVGLHKGVASVTPAYRRIHRNYLLATYNSQEAVDNDDGSAYYETTHNFIVYGGNGLKSDFGGHHNHHERNIYAYVGKCFVGGPNLRFADNVCQLMHSTGYGSDCGLPFNMSVRGNEVRTPDGQLPVCNTSSLTEWVAAGHDPGTTLSAWLDAGELIARARELLLHDVE
jgi:hypothetical protein